MEGKGKERLITALIICINNVLISAVETSLTIIIIIIIIAETHYIVELEMGKLVSKSRGIVTG